MSRFTNHYLQLPSHFYREQQPEPLEQARLLHFNQPLAQELGLTLSSEQLLQITAGQALATGMTPIAQKYTGHQFGYYNPDLGDGRGLLLGQIFDAEHTSWDLHLKGAGRTPFSRRGDGRAVLRSAVREYLVGEALHHLGVPTSRCLSLCHSPETVWREQPETRASYLRVARTHIRFGHFEWLAEQRDYSGFTALAEYVIRHIYPHLAELPAPERYAELYREICRRTAALVAQWQAVGFCHGVMNSDNMSVAGETFDFGPYAFLDDFKLHYVCNHSDHEGRYAYSQQPNIALWNCQVLGQAFATLLSSAQIESGLTHFVEHYNQCYLQAMGAKFGLISPATESKHFIADSLILLDQSGLDFHHFFRLLAKLETDEEDQWWAFVGHSKAWREWHSRYLQQTQTLDRKACRTQIESHSAQFILRNHIAQTVIEQCTQGNDTLLANTMQWLQTPFAPPEQLQQQYPHFLHPPAAHQKGLALSCSS
ncbi:MAG: YdiU family protein [Thiotrichales bacterium]|nr:YdiU family protein [Thiotrichales bacterium]